MYNIRQRTKFLPAKTGAVKIAIEVHLLANCLSCKRVGKLMLWTKHVQSLSGLHLFGCCVVICQKVNIKSEIRNIICFIRGSTRVL